MIHESQVKVFIEKISHSLLENDDICSHLCFPNGPLVKVHVSAKKSQLIFGLPFLKTFMETLYPNCQISLFHKDNTEAKCGQIILEAKIDIKDLLKFKENTLYFLSRMSAIAHLVRKYQQVLEKSQTRLCQPRFFTPSLSFIEKEAFRGQGVESHTRFFQKTVAIQPEHIKVHSSLSNLFESLTESLPPTTRIEIHVENLNDLKKASSLGADLIVLKNFDKNSLRLAKHINQGRSYLEVTGHLSLEDVKEIAPLGLNFLSSELILAESGFSDLFFETFGPSYDNEIS